VLNGVLILDRPLASGSSLKIGCRPSRSPLLFEASPRRAGGTFVRKRAFIEMSGPVESKRLLALEVSTALWRTCEYGWGRPELKSGEPDDVTG